MSRGSFTTVLQPTKLARKQACARLRASGTKATMKLYGSYTSPFVRHCRVALLETGLECEFVETTSTSPTNKSPTKKVPYFEDGSVRLSDSSSIVRYIRERAGQVFLADTEAFDFFCQVNTYMDAGINVFLFERLDGLLPDKSEYLARQTARVEAGLDELERGTLPTGTPLSDEFIRLACLLGWGRFRNRFSLERRPGLADFLRLADGWAPFADTAPPEGA